MDGGNEQRVAIKFCFRAGLSATETLELVQKAYGNEALNRSNVFRWYSRFRDGRELVEVDEECWPSKIDSNWGKHCCCCWFGQKWPSNRIENDSRIFEHPQNVRILKEDLGKRMLCASFFHTPWHLSKGKIESHFTKTLSRCPMQTKKKINNVITGDETWCFANDPETKRQSSEWVGETFPRPKKLKFQIFFRLSSRSAHRIRTRRKNGKCRML